MVDGRKMSKSLGNFYTLRDIEERGFPPQAFRLLVMSGHYQNETNFSWEILEAAQNRLNNWLDAAALIHQGEYGEPSPEFEDNLLSALTNNLDTPAALSLVDAFIDQINSDPLAAKLKARQLVESLNKLLGINLNIDHISPQQKGLIAKRSAARANKDWAESDRIRDLLFKQGIKLKDTEHGQVWSRD
jgi:cysteinyl-tRNA synthetase